MKLERGAVKPLKLAQNGLPQLDIALDGVVYPLTAVRICKSLVDGFLQEIETKTETKGVIQPLSAQEVAIKPEGQRTWKWMDLYCHTDLLMNPDDIVAIDGVRYRVMAVYEYRHYGFMHYELAQNYEEANT